MSLHDIVSRLLRHIKTTFGREPWWAELWAALGALMWSSWVFFTGSDLGYGDAYRVIISIADESFWVVSGLSLGLMHIAAVLSDQRTLRRVAAGLAMWWWSILFLSMFLVVPKAPGLSLFLVMACINAFSVLRTAPCVKV
jgi:hypothetical protein